MKSFENESYLRERWTEILDKACEEGLREGIESFLESGYSRLYDFQNCFWNGSIDDENVCFMCGAERLVATDEESCTAVKIQLTEGHACEREAKTYEDAVENGWGDYFCPIEKLMDYEFSPSICFAVWVMPLVDCDEGKVYKSCVENDEDDDGGDDYEGYINTALKIGGELDSAAYFYGFLDEHCCNDLHEGNWGFMDGRMLIVDYAGYGID